MDDFIKKIIEGARACMNTPFRHQGRIPGRGIDCAGLVLVAARNAGIELVDYSGYPGRPFDGMLKKMLDSQIHLFEVPIGDMRSGDVLLMRVTQAPQHLSLMTDPGYIIHAYQEIGFVSEHILAPELQQKIVAVYRFNHE